MRTRVGIDVLMRRLELVDRVDVPALSGADRLRRFLDDNVPRGELDAPATAVLLTRLIDASMAELPLPASGQTLQRWRLLAEVASHDLSLVKLFEGHTDAIATLHEVDATKRVIAGSTWGLWAAEPPEAKVLIQPRIDGRITLTGRKAWCSGAASVTHALLTTWRRDGSGPFLMMVDMRQPGIRVVDGGWAAVGMAASASLEVRFDGAVGMAVGAAGAYLRRPGFSHGAAGIAACWWGAARSLARALHRGSVNAPPGVATAFKRAALGRVDLALAQTAALLRDAAEWIDAHPRADATAVALRTRLSAEASATLVLDEVGRALGAAAFCRDARFARMAADLPVYLRQSHAERDQAALGDRMAHEVDPWSL